MTAMPRSRFDCARAVRRCLVAGFPALFFRARRSAWSSPPRRLRPPGLSLFTLMREGAIGPTSCPRTTTGSRECTLAEALSKSVAGSTIALATPGRKGHYVGNWIVSTLAFSPSAPLTIEPALGVADPTLDGNHGKPTGCQTKICGGPVLTIASGVHVNIDGITIQDADNAGHGGAIDNSGGGTVIVSASTFYGNTAGDGGAIDNGDKGGGVLSVSASMFSHNTATSDGGGIDNGDRGSAGHRVGLHVLGQHRHQRRRRHRQCRQGQCRSHHLGLHVLGQPGHRRRRHRQCGQGGCRSRHLGIHVLEQHRHQRRRCHRQRRSRWYQHRLGRSGHLQRRLRQARWDLLQPPLRRSSGCNPDGTGTSVIARCQIAHTIAGGGVVRERGCRDGETCTPPCPPIVNSAPQ